MQELVLEVELMLVVRVSAKVRWLSIRVKLVNARVSVLFRLS